MDTPCENKKNIPSQSHIGICPKIRWNRNSKTASSGIAASLLKLGRSRYSRFKLHIPAYPESTCYVSPCDTTGFLLESAKLIVVTRHHDASHLPDSCTPVHAPIKNSYICQHCTTYKLEVNIRVLYLNVNKN